MSGRVSPESDMASHDQFAPEIEQSGFYRWARPPMQPGPQQPLYPPSYYHQYPGAASYPINTFAPYQQLATQTAPAPARWGAFDLFDEEEQERRKKGKELVPTWPVTNAPPPPWIAYPGGYGPRDYAPLETHMWPALPLSQPTPLHALPIPGDLGHTPRKPAKHVRHQDQLSEIGQGQRPRSQQSQSKIIRGVNGILTPNSGDLTVHLTMDLEEDLEDRLDEMSRLSRLGEFSLAKKYFQEHLHHHIDNPYVLVQYADLLLHQGEFKGVTLLKDDVMYRFEGEQPNSEELRILRINWELLQVLARSKTMESLSDAPAVFEEAVSVLAALAKDSPPDRPISSTEIEILALILQLTGHPVLNSKWLRYGARAIAAFSTTFLSLYQTLLRQGRIWDLHDLIVLLPTIEDIKALTHDIFGKDLIPSLEAMVSDWSDSIHEYDASTTLGLLSIMTHILLEPVEASEKECIDILKLCLPLAISVTENDPNSLKSRAYLRVLLAKSRFVETASRQAINTLTSQLQSAQGIFYHSDIATLPIYVPSGSETPQWTVMDQHPELKDPVKLVLRSAIELDDLKTEALARQELIRLSNNPRDEFDMLCDLQLTRQRDLRGYGLSLASKYLVSSTKAVKEELSILISRLLSKVASTDYWDPSHEWVLNMLLYNLEGRSPSTIKYKLERSHTDYENIDESLLREISRKIPILKEWVDQQTGSPSQTKVKSTVLRTGYGSRRSRRPATRRPSSSRAARAVEQSSTREKRSPVNDKKEERETPLMTGAKPEGSGQDHVAFPESGFSYMHPVNDGQQNNLEHQRTSQETPVTTVSRPNDNPEDPRRSLNEDELIDAPVNERRHDDIDVAAQIRRRLEAEYSKRLEAEKNSEQERRKERMALLEGLKREVEAIRKEAVEQAERKARVEEHERAEQLRWERRLEESKLEKEMAMAKAEIAAAERDAKFEVTRQMAIKDAEKRMKEEYEMRRMKEDEARELAEFEISKRIEAEKKAIEAVKAAKKLREEREREIEIEERKKQEALAASMRRAEEDRTRQWAAEQAEREVESQSQIHFKDAIGRKYAIPFSQGRTWESMRGLIEAAFAHVDVVGPEVQDGHYDLLGPDGSIILPQAWEQIIQPGWNITMHMWPIADPNLSQPPELQPPTPGHNVLAGGLLSPPPVPLGQNANAEAVINEADSTEHIDDDISSDYGSSTRSWKPSRTRRIANAFSALKTTIFRRRRRASSATISTASSELA